MSSAPLDNPPDDLLGSHLSVAGGLVNALHEAKRLALGCVQVFTRNQRQWTAKPIDDAERVPWMQALHEMGWDDPGQPRVVSHNSYLVNLASPDPQLARRSLDAQRAELERCEALAIPLCVMHPGAHLDPAGVPNPRPKGAPDGTITEGERAGLLRVAKALDAIHRELPGFRVLTLLETTAGGGTHLGYDFAHLAFIREAVREPHRVAFCVDTCHIFAAGYDLSTPEAAAATWKVWDERCGLDSVRAFHLNDSVGACGSRLDRHAHIGDGLCGVACFQSVLNQPRFARVPKVLETPKGDDARGRNWDLVNVERLRALAGRASNAPRRDAARTTSRPATTAASLGNSSSATRPAQGGKKAQRESSRKGTSTSPPQTAVGTANVSPSGKLLKGRGSSKPGKTPKPSTAHPSTAKSSTAKPSQPRPSSTPRRSATSAATRADKTPTQTRGRS